MEHQSTDNNTIKHVENKIVCRKCGGNHFTIKCGKEKQEQNIDKVEDNSKKNQHSEIPVQKLVSNKTYEKKSYFKITYKVKLSELPIDMTEEEMMELTNDWGHIVRIKVLNYQESSTAYIDFGYKEEAEYFVKAIDKTPFESLIISAQIVKN